MINIYNANAAILCTLFYVLSFFSPSAQIIVKAWVLESDKPDSSPFSVTLYFHPRANHITCIFLGLIFLLCKMVIMLGISTSQAFGKALGRERSELVSRCYCVARVLRKALLQPSDSWSMGLMSPLYMWHTLRKGELSISELAEPQHHSWPRGSYYFSSQPRNAPSSALQVILGLVSFFFSPEKGSPFTSLGFLLPCCFLREACLFLHHHLCHSLTTYLLYFSS